MSADFDSSTGAGKGLRTLYGSIGRGGFEGVHTDDRGNVYLIEDAGGTTVNFGKNPNSFVYRFVPTNPSDLTQGKLQALQVSINGAPLMFIPVDATHPTGDMLSANQLFLHTVGASWAITWVTIHDTAVDGTASFNANAAAKIAGATPFKRPENMAFQPGAHFQTFFFDVTGDTDARAGNQPDLAARGSWGGIFRVDLSNDRNTGAISLIVLGDADHASFDNLTFADNKDTLLAAEDRGDTLHDQLNKLDSVWAYNVKTGASARLVALGADRMAPPATEEDNEPTGLHMSDGDASIRGLAGSKELNHNTGLLFVTQQHGENNLFQIFRRE
jgi:secreted PhoX family phosphatase